VPLAKTPKAKTPKKSVEGNKTAEPKKRGRKLTEPKKYFDESQKKIDEWRRILTQGQYDNGKVLNKKQKEGLRNRVSAQESRRKKKLELKSLQDKLNDLGINFSTILDVLEEFVNEEDKGKVANELLGRISEKAFLKNASVKDRFSSVLMKFMNFD